MLKYVRTITCVFENYREMGHITKECIVTHANLNFKFDISVYYR